MHINIGLLFTYHYGRVLAFRLRISEVLGFNLVCNLLCQFWFVVLVFGTSRRNLCLTF
jgi:hypothetical protein